MNPHQIEMNPLAPAPSARHRLRATHRGDQRRFQRQDLVVARRIQRSFLPPLCPTVEGYPVATEYLPAYNVGGDFYDVVGTSRGRIAAVMGDVSGKGVSSALVMARVSSEIRRLAPTMTSPCDLVQRLNATFAPAASDDLFVTLVCVTLDARSRQLTVCNAGHVLPLVRGLSGTVVALGMAAGPPIGMFGDHRYQDETFDLVLGDVLLLMTDGITEALHTAEDCLGRTRLGQIIGAAPPSGREINRRILAALEGRSSTRRLDDIALLSIDVTSETLLGS